MMGIRKKILNGLASWILKQIPADKPSQASDSGDKATRNKVGSENQKDGAITAAADKLDDGLIVEASLDEGRQELLGLPLNETAKDQLEQHVATNYEKPTQNNQSKSSVSQTDSENKPDSSKIKLRLEEEQQQAEVQRRKQEAERQRIEAEGKATANNIINASLTDKILKEKGIEATERLANSTNAKVIVIGSGKDGMPIILGGNN